jgi:nucleoside-triphosphatase THEP1
VFTKLQSNSTTWIEGIKIGLEMNLRAVILIMGFTVLGTELYNPKIRKFFSNGYFRQLPVALELSLESLPAMIANTPDVKTLLTQPRKVVKQMILYAGFRLNEVRKNYNIFENKLFLLTGAIGSGKTTLIKKLIERMRVENLSVAGIYSLRKMDQSGTTGYDVIDISTGSSERFLRTEGAATQEKVGRFFLYPEGLNAGEAALLNVDHSDLIIVDEIGKLELARKGWSASVQQLLKVQNSCLLLSVREELIAEISREFAILPQKVFRVSGNNTDEIISEILEEMRSQSNPSL